DTAVRGNRGFTGTAHKLVQMRWLIEDTHRRNANSRPTSIVGDCRSGGIICLVKLPQRPGARMYTFLQRSNSRPTPMCDT
ncbi:MAG: hypothetical protein ABI024_06860, partial [Vicinamibacterales bacterium]